MASAAQSSRPSAARARSAALARATVPKCAASRSSTGAPGKPSRAESTAPISSSTAPSFSRAATRSKASLRPASASAAISERIAATISALWRSSSTSKRGETPASSGKRRRSESQKAWMVWIFSPPGVSSARAKSRRARASVSGFATALSAPASAASSAPSRSSAAIAQPPSMAKRRVCISAAAALV